MNIIDYAKLAKLSQLKTFDQNAYAEKEFKLGQYKLSFYNVKGTEFIALFVKNVMYISFRGTELSSADIVPHVVRCSTKTINMGKVHSGYLSKLEQVLPTLKRKLKNNRVKKVVYIGHSLGGALAQLAYLQLRNRFSGESKCITFGSCKPIKKLPNKFVSTNDVKNYYLLKDHVGLFPYGYKVITEPIILNSDKSYSKDAFPIWNLFKTFHAMFITKRHSIDTYIKELE